MSTDRLVLAYQKGRQLAMDGKLEHAAEVAESLGLSAGQTALLVATCTHWHLNKDKEAFLKALKPIYSNEAFEPHVRALAAEHASSCFDAEEAVAWSERALALGFELGEVDAMIVRFKVLFGLWERGLEPVTWNGVNEALDVFLECGAYDAPSRVKWWVEYNQNGPQDLYMPMLQRAAAIDTDATSCNIYYVRWCRGKLEELRAST